ncbi:MAG: NPCBM/NEW2 domain-containing protein [Planctomycetota bacterium]|nr:NPCBM/NEW2 domain-containing protein [Planctomycetota bacterium]
MEAVAAAREAYIASLQQALDVAMSAANLEDAKWAKSEIERIKAGEAASAEKPKLSMAAAAQTRFARAGEKSQEDRKRSLEAARRQYLIELEAAKRTALSVAKDLEEAGRIAAEIERSKVMEFAQAEPGAAAAAGNAASPASAAERKPGKINLLKLVDLERDPVMYGIWKWEKEGLFSDGPGWKTIRLPYQPPAEYDYSVEFTVTGAAKGELLLNAAAGDRSFFFNAGIKNTPFYYFGYINGRWDNSSTVRLPKGIDEGVRAKSTIKVRADGVTGWINDKQVTKLDAEYPSLIHDANELVVGLHVLGISTGDKVVIHAAEVTEISGPGRIIRHIDAQQMRTQSQALKSVRVGKTVSLTELRPRAKQVGSGAYMINQNGYAQPVMLDGRECLRYIYAHAPSSVIFDIPEGAIGFRAIGTRPAGSYPADSGQWRLAVCVDDCEAFLSRGIQEEKGRITVDVPIPKGSRQIELRADPLGNLAHDGAIWTNPEFLFPQ